MSTTKPKPLKTTNYYCTENPEMEIKQVYVKLVNDNLVHLINHIYNHKDHSPYDQASVRSTIAMQLILGANKLIPFEMSSMIAKDLEDLRKNDEYTSLWANPALKRKALNKELELLRKQTEIDETVSLNLSDPKAVNSEQSSLEDFDLHSGLSTLNVSAKYPLPNENKPIDNCNIM